MGTGLRIVRLANFITPTSGGLRTALRELGRRYLAAGHEPVLITPGAEHTDRSTSQGRIVTLPGPRVPALGGYRILLNRRAVVEMLDQIAPHRLEVSDRTTLRWTGTWARRNGIGSVMVSHESLEGLLGTRKMLRPIACALAKRLNRATSAAYDRIVCTTSWAAAEFHRAGIAEVAFVPLGVDLETFHPSRRSAQGRLALASPDEILIVCCVRLSPEKRPDRTLITLRSLLAQGITARLVIIGDGPLRNRLMVQAQDLPVNFAGWIHDRRYIAEIMANADIVMVPGPIETFGLAALEALASGTPVVASDTGALPEVIGPAGVPAQGDDFAAPIIALLAGPRLEGRTVARTWAESFSWDESARGFLAVHEGLGS